MLDEYKKVQCRQIVIQKRSMFALDASKYIVAWCAVNVRATWHALDVSCFQTQILADVDILHCSITTLGYEWMLKQQACSVMPVE